MYALAGAGEKGRVEAEQVIVLRQYQADSIEALRAGIRAGHKRQIVCAPTGSGKTEVGMALINEAVAKYSKTAFICDRIAILDQTSERFDKNQIPHGIIQAGHWRWRPYERAQICSAQTLARRGTVDGLKLIIVDEAHTLYRATVNFLLAHPEIITIGLTATPFSKGLGEIYTNIVNITTTNALMAEGYLSPLRVFSAKAIDVRGMKVKSTGEWDEHDMEKRGLEIVGDVVAEWKTKTQELFGGPVKTIVFSATVAHGEELCRQWQAEGFNFQQVSYKDNDKDRRDLIETFRKPDSEIAGLVSCEALAKGFDVPDILMGVSCRPYRKSLSGHIQQVGRVMRQFPGKEFAAWNDHSGNFLRFYHDTTEFFEHGLAGLSEDHLDSTARKEPEEYEKRQILCGNCSAILSPSATMCLSCGTMRPKRSNDVEHLPGEMRELDIKGAKKKRPEWMEDKDTVWRMIVGHAINRKGGDLVAAEKFALAQFRNMYDEWPYRNMANVEPMEPSPEVVSRIKHQMIRYFKGRAKSEQQEERAT
jgi:superfamily II DNA or RNA helicase